MFLAVTFLHPGLLWGLPLVAVPIVLHLLFRRRAVRRPWAAIELLKRAIDRTRRKRRFEEWIVLLLRSLAMLALVLLVARPLSGPVLGASGTHRIFVIDDSRSMEHTGSNASAFELAKRALRDEIRRAIERDRGELVTVLRTSEPDEPLVEGLSVGDEAIRRLDRRIDALETRSSSTDQDALFRALARRSESIAERSVRIDWFTDFLAHDWSADRQGGLDALLDAESGRGVELVLRQVELPRAANLGIQSIGVRARRLVAKVPTPLVVRVRNDGPERFVGGLVTVELDGLRADPLDVPQLGAGEEVELEFPVAFDDPGAHAVSMSLPSDGYTPDDQRCFALDLQAETRVVIVDGEPDERARGSESWMLRAAIDPTDEVQHSVDLRLTDRSQLSTWTEEDWQGVDLLALCDVAGIDPGTRTAIGRFVASGGGVLLFTGDQCDAESLQQDFFETSLDWLGVRALGVEGDPTTPYAIDVADVAHPMFGREPALFARIFGSLIRVGRWTRFEIDADAGLEVPLRVTNPRGDPFYFGRVQDGGGAVFVCASSADDSWNNLGAHPALLTIAQHALESAARRPLQSSQNTSASEPVAVDVDLGRFRPQVELIDPRDDSVLASGDAAAEGDDPDEEGRLIGRWSVDRTQFDREGLFALRLRAYDDTDSIRLVARNTDPTEGRLAPVSPEAFLAALDDSISDRVQIEPADSDSGAGSSDGSGGPWRMIAVLALLLLLAETGWTSLRGGPTA
ncbi:MAG: BatA and WFA domain-containing protein [Planctomycetota bacterium]